MPPEAGVPVVCLNNSKEHTCVQCSCAGERGGRWGPLGLDFN